MGTRVYIGRLSNSARERDVERFFKGYGKVREIVLKEGYGFVEFDNNRDADDAVYDLNGKELLGDRVIVEFAKAPGSGRGGRTGSSRASGYDRSSYSGRYGSGRDSGRGYRPDRPRNLPPVRTDYRITVENLSSRVSWQVNSIAYSFAGLHPKYASGSSEHLAVPNQETELTLKSEEVCQNGSTKNCN